MELAVASPMELVVAPMELVVAPMELTVAPMELLVAPMELAVAPPMELALLRVYYTNKTVLYTLVAVNEMFFLMLYYCKYDKTVAVSVFGIDMCLSLCVLWISFPFLCSEANHKFNP